MSQVDEAVAGRRFRDGQSDRLLGPLIVLAVLAGLVQNPATASFPWLGSLASIVDDALLLLAFAVACVIGGQRWSFWAVLWATILVSLTGFAVLFSVLPTNLAVGLARQIMLPVVAVLVGMRLGPRGFAQVTRIAALVGLWQVPFVIAERWGLRLFDPSALVQGRGWTIPIVDGLPGYYFYYFSQGGLNSLFGSVFIRSGGLVLNPPVAGLMMAIAAVIVWRQRWKYHRALVTLALFGSALTWSRGGWVVALCGLCLPFLLSRFRVIGFIAALLAFVYVSQRFADANVGAASHVNGLTEGLTDALRHPLGLDFGNSGNLLIDRGYDVAGESLAGILFSALGVMGLLLFVVAFIAVGVKAVLHPDVWQASLFLGLMITVLLSETGGAMYGTLGAWVIVGTSFGDRALSREHLGETISLPDGDNLLTTGLAIGTDSSADSLSKA